VSVTATPQAGEQVVSTYSYDGLGRRVQEVVDTSCQEPPLWSESAEDDYYAGQQVVETRDAGGDVQYQYLWSPRYTDAPILRDTYQTVGDQQSIALPQRVFYLADANYNVTGLLKYDSGSGTWQAVERYTYTPYGAVTYRNADWTTASSSANNNTILYTGHTLDLSTGLYYYRARYYDAVLERFINRDPIGYSGGLNLYEYVGDDPTTRTDPSGLAWQCFYDGTGTISVTIDARGMSIMGGHPFFGGGTWNVKVYHCKCKATCYTIQKIWLWGCIPTNYWKTSVSTEELEQSPTLEVPASYTDYVAIVTAAGGKPVSQITWLVSMWSETNSFLMGCGKRCSSLKGQPTTTEPVIYPPDYIPGLIP
jgi:RHS repeat-associated protein